MLANTRAFYARAGYRLLALLILVPFAAMQYHWWMDGRKAAGMVFLGQPLRKPVPILGPLYFLVHPDTQNAPLGIALLCVMVPALLSFIVWPRWWTCMLMCLAVLAWIVPGILTIMSEMP
jgi:hypothetical protein